METRERDMPATGGATLRRWLPLGILIAGAGVSVALLCGRSLPAGEAPAASPPAIAVVHAALQDVGSAIQSQGTVEPRVEIDLVVEVPGRVRAVSSSLDPGARFSEGDVLVEIDPREAELAVRRAEARVAGAGAELALTTDDRDRIAGLAERQTASAASLSSAVHRHGAALAAFKEAQAILEQANYELERTIIRAPFDGRARAKAVGVGQVVDRGTAVARIYATDYAEVRLPFRIADLLLAGVPLSGRSVDGHPPARVLLEAELGGRTFRWEGVVDRADGQISHESRMAGLVARVEDPYGLRSPAAGSESSEPLLPGLFVQAEVRGKLLREVVLLPESAIHRGSEVFVVGPDDRLELREIEIAQRRGGVVVVAGGLEPGARVAHAAATLVEGMRVRPELLAWKPPAERLVIGSP